MFHNNAHFIKPKSSAFINRISAKFYEMGVIMKHIYLIRDYSLLGNWSKLRVSQKTRNPFPTSLDKYLHCALCITLKLKTAPCCSITFLLQFRNSFPFIGLTSQKLFFWIYTLEPKTLKIFAKNELLYF